MKDYLGKARFWNAMPKNPTQTKYLRFMKTPKATLSTSFEDSVENFRRLMERHKTVYEKYVGDLGEEL